MASCSGGTTSDTEIADDIAEQSDVKIDTSDLVAKPPGASFLEIAEIDGAQPDCSKKTPGPDIDAAVLYSDPSISKIKGQLSECTWLVKGTACPENAHQKPSAAEGEETDSPVSGFVSLNGGSIICRWSNNTTLTLGNLVQVYEVGAKDEAEPFRIRGCVDAEANDCGSYITVDRDKMTVPAGKILPPNKR